MVIATTVGGTRNVIAIGARTTSITTAIGIRIGTAAVGMTAGAGTSCCVSMATSIGGTTTTFGGTGITRACVGARAIHAGVTTVGTTATGRVRGPAIAGASAGNDECQGAGAIRPQHFSGLESVATRFHGKAVTGNSASSNAL
jgi:hypothetical protein